MLYNRSMQNLKSNCYQLGKFNVVLCQLFRADDCYYTNRPEKKLLPICQADELGKRSSGLVGVGVLLVDPEPRHTLLN